jgi:hypothetical protein
MAQCIFCDDLLNKETKPEHILMAALGGRKTSQVIICSNCNQTFGGTIDNAFASQVEFIRNLLQLKSGTGNPPPMLRGIQTSEEKLNIASDGTPILIMKPFTFEDNGDGTFNVQISCRTLSELEKIIPHLAGALKKTEEQVRASLKGGTLRSIEKPPGLIQQKISVGGLEALRSVTKSCLTLWSSEVGGEEARKAPYEQARRFVASGSANLNQRLCALDSRPLPLEEKLKKDYGDFFNFIFIRSNDDGRVIGHFSLYNTFCWRVLLAESGGITNRSIALALNPQDTLVWSDKIANQFALDFVWLESPVYSLPEAKKRFEAVMQYNFEMSRRSAIAKIFDTTFGKHSADKGVLEPQRYDEFCGELSDRVARHMLGLSYEQKISVEEIEQLFKK